jgi:tagaturonate epimerase
MSEKVACVTLGLSPSFGFGDRSGLATPGHVESMRRGGSGIEPIFPQQSIREMARTGRSPEQVMDDAISGATRSGFHGPMGADADHLKSAEDVDRTVASGYTFFTLDPSEYVVGAADRCDEATLQRQFDAIRSRISWMDDYRGRSVALSTGTLINLDDAACVRCAVKYGVAILKAIELSDRIRRRNEEAGRDFEIELSVDETEQPTTLAEHWIIAEQCLERGMKLVSLAPRYVGDFEKGVDYQGSLEQFERSLADHAAVANQVGPYKLSLHSGSDKLSIYSVFARLTRGRFHVKTAGTSYLEALRVVARHEPALFRRIVEFARSRYDTDRASYHVSAAVGGVPSPADVPDGRELERLYLELWSEVPPGRGFTAPGRQILHCTFGSVLTDPELGPALRGVLEAHLGAYEEVLDEHFQRHLAALQAGL